MEEYYEGMGRDTFSGLDFLPDYSVSGLARYDCIWNGRKLYLPTLLGLFDQEKAEFMNRSEYQI